MAGPSSRSVSFSLSTDDVTSYHTATEEILEESEPEAAGTSARGRYPKILSARAPPTPVRDKSARFKLPPPRDRKNDAAGSKAKQKQQQQDDDLERKNNRVTFVEKLGFEKRVSDKSSATDRQESALETSHDDTSLLALSEWHEKVYQFCVNATAYFIFACFCLISITIAYMGTVGSERVRARIGKVVFDILKKLDVGGEVKPPEPEP